MEEKESLWKISSELNNMLGKVNVDVEAVSKSYESHIASTESLILEILEIKQILSKINIKSLDDFLNFCLFISTFSLDISVVLHRYILSKLPYELVYFSKSSALLCFEYLNSIHNAFNKFAKSAPVIFQPDVILIKTTLKQFGKIKKNFPQLETTRNLIAAHRHDNSFEYMKITYEMDSYKYIDLIGDMLKINNALFITNERILKKYDEVLEKALSKR